MSGGGRVPKLARRLLQLTVGREDAGAAVDELEELLEARHRRDGVPPARLTVWRHVAGFPSRVLAERLRGLRAGSRAGRARRRGGITFPELRHLLRRLGREPGFALPVLASLSFALAAAACVLALVRAILIAPLPYPDPDRLLALWETDPERGGAASRVAALNALDWGEESRSLEALAVFGEGSVLLEGDAGDPQMIAAPVVTASFFDVLGIAPALGRGFRPLEERGGSEPVVLLSDALWRSRFGADPEIVGSGIRLDGVPHRVVGVLPSVPLLMDVPTNPRLTLSYEPRAVWRPLKLDSPCASARRCHVFGALGRLRPGISPQAAQLELDGLARSLVERGRASSDYGIRAVPLADEIVGDFPHLLATLVAAVALVLLMTASNVFNLAAVRATGRRRELAVRAALGAGRLRIALPGLLEGLLLGLAAAGLALAATGPALRALIALYGSHVPRGPEIGVDGALAAAVLGVGALAGSSVALPVLFAGLSRDLRGPLAGEGRAATESRRARLLRRALVAVQMAAVTALLVSAGLLAKSLWRLLLVEPGFRAEGLVVARVVAPAAFYSRFEQLTALGGAVAARVSALPGVASASVAYDHPLRATWIGGFRVAGAEREPEAEAPSGRYRPVAPGYFRTAGIALKRGRDFDRRDTSDGPGVVIVNETLARRHLRGDPIGQRLLVDSPRMMWGEQRPLEYEIVGVAADVRFLGLDREPEPAFYLPWDQGPYWFFHLLARAGAGSETIAPALRGAVREADPRLPVPWIEGMPAIEARAAAPRRFNALFVGALGGFALALAVVGVYGIVRYSAARRTREVGVRLVLGATPGEVVRAVMSEGIAIAGLGLGTGALVSLAAARLLESQLYGVDARDPAVYAVALGGLLAVSAAASLLPARRAARVDPASAPRD